MGMRKESGKSGESQSKVVLEDILKEHSLAILINFKLNEIDGHTKRIYEDIEASDASLKKVSRSLYDLKAGRALPDITSLVIELKKAMEKIHTTRNCIADELESIRQLREKVGTLGKSEANLNRELQYFEMNIVSFIRSKLLAKLTGQELQLAAKTAGMIEKLQRILNEAVADLNHALTALDAVMTEVVVAMNGFKTTKLGQIPLRANPFAYFISRYQGFIDAAEQAAILADNLHIVIPRREEVILDAHIVASYIKDLISKMISVAK